MNISVNMKNYTSCPEILEEKGHIKSDKWIEELRKNYMDLEKVKLNDQSLFGNIFKLLDWLICY
jgi:hypothetical protein